MSSIFDWSLTAADNANSDAAINWAEGQAPSTVNNSAREMMARVAEYLADYGGALVAGGTANVITVTTNSPFTAYADGLILALRIAADNTDATTINANGIGAKSVRKMLSTGENALTGAELQADGIYLFRYSTALNTAAGGWLLLNPTIDIATPIKTSVDLAAPVGMVVDYAGLTAPTSWLFCFGQAVSRATYAGLFAVLGTTYGVGDGSTTFNLPDARGRVTAGQDDMGGTSANRLTGLSGGVDGDVLGAAGGAESHTLTTAQLAAHTHTGTTNSGGTHTHTLDYDGAHGSSSTNRAGDPRWSWGDISHTNTPNNAVTQSGGAHTHAFTTDSSGSGSAHNNVQPTLILNKIIKALAA